MSNETAFFFGLQAYFCLFALHPCLFPSPCPSLHMTLPNPRLGFPLEGQPCRIYPSEIKRGKEKKPLGASKRKDCISRREPQDRHTGQQTSNTDSLDSCTPTSQRDHSYVFSCTKNDRSSNTPERQGQSTLHLHIVSVSLPHLSAYCPLSVT